MGLRRRSRDLRTSPPKSGKLERYVILSEAKDLLKTIEHRKTRSFASNQPSQRERSRGRVILSEAKDPVEHCDPLPRTGILRFAQDDTKGSSPLQRQSSQCPAQDDAACLRVRFRSSHLHRRPAPLSSSGSPATAPSRPCVRRSFRLPFKPDPALPLDHIARHRHRELLRATLR